MPTPNHRLATYFSSDSFATDFQNLEKHNPAEAAKQLHKIIDSLNGNLAAIGITPTCIELEVQAEFVAGRLPLLQMLDYCRTYAESITLRWPK